MKLFKYNKQVYTPIIKVVEYESRTWPWRDYTSCFLSSIIYAKVLSKNLQGKELDADGNITAECTGVGQTSTVCVGEYTKVRSGYTRSVGFLLYVWGRDISCSMFTTNLLLLRSVWRLIHIYHAVPLPFPCRVTLLQDSDCLPHLNNTVWLWFTQPMPCSCCDRAVLWPCRFASDV